MQYFCNIEKLRHTSNIPYICTEQLKDTGMTTQQYHPRWLYALLACLLLSSCNRSDTIARLEVAESMMDTNPEEAWYILDSIDGTSLHGEARARYALLATQADYQCYVPLTGDSLIRIATAYYGDSRPGRRAALSYYYLGCTYTEMGDDARAIEAYMKAGTLFPDTTVRHYALCYQNMARHYRNRNMMTESLTAFNRFRTAMLLRGRPLDVANADYQIAVTYLYMERYAEAESRLLALLHNSTTPSHIADNAAFQLAKIACYHTGQYDAAMRYIDRHIASVTDERRLGPDYSVKGDIFLVLGHTDSARHYFRLSLIPGRDVYADCNTYYKLMEMDLADGVTDSVSSYLAHHTELLDSIARMQSRAEIERVHADHAIFLHDRALRQRHTRFLAISIIGIVILALVLLTLFALIDNRRKAAYIRLQKQLAKNRAEMLSLTSMPDDTEAPLMQPDHERLFTLRLQRVTYCREMFAHTSWHTRLNRIEHSTDAEALTLKERTELQQVLIDSFADAMIDLKAECPTLTATDLHLVTLTLLGCSIRTASLCIANSESALRSRKTRMKSKMPEELYRFVFEQSHN